MGASLGNRFFSVTINGANGHCQIVDQRTHVTLGSTEPDAPFGSVTVRSGGHSSRLPLGRCEVETASQESAIVATFHPLENDAPATVHVRLELSSDPHKVRVFHAFGEDRIQLGRAPVSVAREATLDPTAR